MRIAGRVWSYLIWPQSDHQVATGINRASFLLLATYLAVLPLPHTIAVRHIVFFSLLLLTLWAAWRQHLPLHLPLARSVSLYAAVALVSVIYAIDPIFSLGEIKAEVGNGIIALLLAGTWVRSIEGLTRLLGVIVVSSTLLALYVMGSAIVEGRMVLSSLARVGGVSGVGNLSTYLITILPWVAAYALVPGHGSKFRYVVVFAGVIGLVALYLTSNRAGILAIMAEVVLVLVVLAMYKAVPNVKRLLGAGLISLILLSGLFVQNMHGRNMAVFDGTAEGMEHISVDPRWTLWERAVQNIQDHPWIGAGFGREAFELRNPDMRAVDDVYWHTHNMFLGKAVQMGIPGLLAFMTLLVAVFYTFWRPVYKDRLGTPGSRYALAGMAMLCGVIVKNMTDDFFVHDNALLFWVLVGAAMGALAGERPSRPPALHSG